MTKEEVLINLKELEKHYQKVMKSYSDFRGKPIENVRNHFNLAEKYAETLKSASRLLSK